jgi:hypothetical protein
MRWQRYLEHNRVSTEPTRLAERDRGAAAETIALVLQRDVSLAASDRPLSDFALLRCLLGLEDVGEIGVEVQLET